MVRTYFVQIAAVRMAAVLTGRRLCDNYAFHGALERFSPLDIGVIREADGLPDVPEKADSFRFGQVCGRVLSKALAGYGAQELLLREAAVAKGVFLKLTPEAAAGYSPEALKAAVKTIFRALLKYAQIRTHTVKPGSEDINAWLAAYNSLLAGYEPCLEALTDRIVSPDAAQKAAMSAFFSRKDPLVALALRGFSPDAGALEKAVSAEPVSAFGVLLKEILAEAPAGERRR